MHQPLYFDELSLGSCWRSRARTVTETDIIQFAGLSGDFDPLHVDRETAGESPFGGIIAHGLLGMSFMAGLASVSPQVNTVALVEVRNWQFTKPVYVGDTIHVENEITNLQSNGRRTGQVVWRRRLVNQNGQTVQEGELVTLVAHSRVQQKRKPRPEEAEQSTLKLSENGALKRKAA